MAETKPSATDGQSVADSPTELSHREQIAAIRAAGAERHAAFLADIERDILASDGEEKAHHQDRLIRILKSDVASLAEQRDRADDEMWKAEDREQKVRETERETFGKLTEAWKGWAASDAARAELQRKVDRSAWITENMPAIYWMVCVALIVIGGSIATIFGGGA